MTNMRDLKVGDKFKASGTEYIVDKILSYGIVVRYASNGSFPKYGKIVYFPVDSSR